MAAGVHAQSSDADNPYGVEMPKTADTAKSAPKIAPPATAAPATQSQADTAVRAMKKASFKAVKDSILLKKKMTMKAKADSIARVKALKDSVKVAAMKDTTARKRDTTASAKVAVKDTILKARPDSIKAPVAVVVQSPDSAAKTVAADTGVRKPRPKVVREATINSINEMKGRYRSPKTALFMSLIVPGLGQAYVGQNAFNYSRAAVYFGTDILMGALWYHYTVVKHDREVKHYRAFADQNWSQTNYEDSTKVYPVSTDRGLARKVYCDAVQDVSTGTGQIQYNGCLDPLAAPNSTRNYSLFHDYIKGREDLGVDSTHALRAGFPDTYQFYEMIGQDQEFVAGWRDVQNFSFADSVFHGTSSLRAQYISLRATANRYSRMQAWFVGGMVINHIASALDAALTASHHNRELYETQAMWYDRLNFDGGLAFDQGWPLTHLTASFTF